ncbi:MAG: hypothetical protein EB015_17925 [Methylocystaceae bacterium]|nr:hypothetical protein [Methylocystaceae bacterium]
MAQPRRDGSGALFPNDKKGNERAPDWKGDIMINGVVHRISAWDRKSQYGPLLSLQYNPPMNGGQPKQWPREQQPNDDDVPF